MNNKNASKKLDELDCEVIIDRIQEEKSSIAGYLAGP